MPQGHPPLPACPPRGGQPRAPQVGLQAKPGASTPHPTSQPVLPLTRLALRNYGLVIGSNADHAVCGARGR